jgi:hypothetical protein
MPVTNLPHEIHIEIDPTGKITGEVKGIEGPSCESLTAWLDSLGNVTEHKHTRDFDKKAKIQVNHR